MYSWFAPRLWGKNGLWATIDGTPRKPMGLGAAGREQATNHLDHQAQRNLNHLFTHPIFGRSWLDLPPIISTCSEREYTPTNLQKPSPSWFGAASQFRCISKNSYISKLQAVEPRGFFSSFKSLYSCNFYSYGIIQTLLCALSIANPVWSKTHFASVLRPLVSQFTRPPFLFLFMR